MVKFDFIIVSSSYSLHPSPHTHLPQFLCTLSLTYGLFGWEEKMRGKKMERKKMKRKKNKGKSIFSFLLFGWRENRGENKKKENERYVKWHIYPYSIIKYKYVIFI